MSCQSNINFIRTVLNNNQLPVLQHSLTQNTFKANVTVVHRPATCTYMYICVQQWLSCFTHNDSQTFMEGNNFILNYIYKCHGSAVSVYTYFIPAHRSTNNGQYLYQYTPIIVSTVLYSKALSEIMPTIKKIEMQCLSVPEITLCCRW